MELNEHPFGAFQLYTPDSLMILLQGCPCAWWVAGGWAIDLYLGQQTRQHADCDVEIWRADALAFRAHFSLWEFWAPHPDVRDTAWPFIWWPAYEQPPAGVFNAWCRPHSTDAWAFEVLLADHDDQNWHFRRNPTIQQLRSSSVLRTQEGIPYLAPELQLLYKAKQPRPHDEQDAYLAFTHFSFEQKRQFLLMLQAVDPQHPWLVTLSTAE